MPRPYLTSSIEQLETLFAASGQDSPTLKLLAEELTFRKTPRARALGGPSVASKATVRFRNSTAAPSQYSAATQLVWTPPSCRSA